MMQQTRSKWADLYLILVFISADLLFGLVFL